MSSGLFQVDQIIESINQPLASNLEMTLKYHFLNASGYGATLTTFVLNNYNACVCLMEITLPNQNFAK